MLILCTYKSVMAWLCEYLNQCFILPIFRFFLNFNQFTINMRAVATVAAAAVLSVGAETVVPVTNVASAATEKAFLDSYESFLADFDSHAHEELVSKINSGVSSYMQSQAFVGAPGQPKCEGAAGSVDLPKKISAFPGGVTKRVFGMDIAKLVDRLSSKATGAASAQGVLPGLLAAQAISTGAGMIKSSMHTLVQVLPRVLPQTGFQPLNCMPMVTGHNCFGAIQYPITAADFVLADTTDSQLDGVIAGFPTLYKRKVGVTSDAAYKACFSAYMGMHCASLFPRCATAKADQSPTPLGRYPLCFTSCLATLVLCPGMWVEDIMGECSDVSVPPMCSMSLFANYWLLPPQYSSFEDSIATQVTCPEVPASLSGVEADLSSVYDDSNIAASAYSGSMRLPVA